MIIISTALALVAILALAVYFLVLTAGDRATIRQPAETLTQNGLERKYRVVTPSDYENDRAYPVVVALHGYRDRGKFMELYSGIGNLAEDESFIAVFPEGVHRSWDGLFCCGWAYQNQPGDVEFINSLLAKVMEDYQVNERQIFLIGYSNGGILAQRLIEELPDTFTAAAVVMSGAGDGKSTLTLNQAKTPLLLINGEEDNYVPLTASHPVRDGFNFIPAEETLRLWTDHYGCEQATTTRTGGFTTHRFGCDTSPVWHRIYPNTGHRWPQWRVMSPFKSVPDSTRQIWEFFQDSLPG